MRDRCSPAVLRLIDSGQSSSADFLPSALLLSRLLQEDDGRPARILEERGIAREPIFFQLAAMTSASPLSVEAILAHALALTRKRDADETITTEFFLLALLHLDPSLGKLLGEHGLTLDVLEREIVGEPLASLPLDEPLRLITEPDRATAGRILDANANRARESLRVLDDYARFAINDSFLTGEIKRFRHELAELLGAMPASFYLGSRETLRDVGATIVVDGEMTRASPREVAGVNLKRLQEALRSLEEFSKLFDSRIAESIEQLRYRAYTLEKAFVLGDDAREKLINARLYVLLTGSACDAALDWTIAEAAAGGASVFQLREKDLDDRRLLERARVMRRWTRQASALFIVNDRADIARLAEADGVHLGQDDMPVHEARTIMGADALIGVSTHTLEQVRQAILDGASYIGVGPTFPSSTKSFSTLAGLDFVRAAFAEMALPAFAIGGINLQTIDAVVAAGATRVAVSAAIAQAQDPQRVARTICEALCVRET